MATDHSLPTLTVRLNRDETVDEVLLAGVHLHCEQMDAGAWWIGLSDAKGRAMCHLDFTTRKNRRIHLLVRDEGFPVNVTLNGQLVAHDVADVDVYRPAPDWSV